jgi:hypothetical protein
VHLHTVAEEALTHEVGFVEQREQGDLGPQQPRELGHLERGAC